MTYANLLPPAQRTLTAPRALTRAPFPAATPTVVTGADVYAPQSDSHLLIEQIATLAGGVRGRTVLDFCTGSGVIAIAAAGSGAPSVTAVDVSPSAVECAQRNAIAAGLNVTVVNGSFAEAIAAGPYDVVLCNPPYVPAPGASVCRPVPGPTQAWDASLDGRLVIDPLCAATPELLSENGTLILVQSEFSGTQVSVDALTRAGMVAAVTATRMVPFGPVMHSRAAWLEEQGVLAPGCREEMLVVIKATRP